MCKNKHKPSVSEVFREKLSFNSDVEKFHQWRSPRKKKKEQEQAQE